MAYTGIILFLDVAGNTGVAEGRPGQTPRLYDARLRREDDDWEDTWGRAVGWIADRLYVEREAVEAGDLRLVVEAPIFTGKTGEKNAESELVTKCLWACITGFARARRVMVRRVAVSTVRAAFLGNGNLPGKVAKPLARDTCRALGWNPPSLDAADAGAGWWWASQQWAPDLTPPVHPYLLKRGAA
ncbi:hypothetical protein DK419_13325 [Methylobacterium terrae]|uniref:Uncharacterized protein n=1 Tax=Methylobacterium terrae TaxID=2202827 RepID=A0A2U8WPF3_9HYPH|nr:hypothetical protein [Methylobacterium terrae]AWN47176.1 hypothetical protein DK419_13325 [Methylobacterium terrae]